MHSSTAISSARSSIASASLCSSFLRIGAGMSRQDLNANAAAVAARSISSALPRATLASTAPSIGDLVSKLAPEIEAALLPSIICLMPSAFSLASSGAARSRLALNTSDFGVVLSMGGLRFQSLVDVVALPTGFLVVDLHVKGQRELAGCKNRVQIAGEHSENVFAGSLAACEIAALAEPKHHGEKAEMRSAIADRIVFAPDGTDTDPANGENTGLDRCLADKFDDLAHIDSVVEVGGILNGEMRHLGLQ